MTEKDYYKTLGLNQNASTDEIKRAYRNLAMQYHPDRNHGKEEWANDKFKDINEAFSVLGDPKKKQRYDYYGAIGDIGDIFTSQATRTTFEDLLNDFGEADLGFDFLDDIFDYTLKRRSYAFRKFRRGFNEHAGSRFEAHVDIDFENLFEKTINPKVSNVNYEIVLSKEQAMKGMEKELVRNGKRLKIKIPVDVKTGSKIRLKNALIRTDNEPGDIMITIKIK